MNMKLEVKRSLQKPVCFYNVVAVLYSTNVLSRIAPPTAQHKMAAASLNAVHRTGSRHIEKERAQHAPYGIYIYKRLQVKFHTNILRKLRNVETCGFHLNLKNTILCVNMLQRNRYFHQLFCKIIYKISNEIKLRLLFFIGWTNRNKTPFTVFHRLDESK